MARSTSLTGPAVLVRNHSLHDSDSETDWGLVWHERVSLFSCVILGLSDWLVGGKSAIGSVYGKRKNWHSCTCLCIASSQYYYFNRNVMTWTPMLKPKCISTIQLNNRIFMCQASNLFIQTDSSDRTKLFSLLSHYYAFDQHVHNITKFVFIPGYIYRDFQWWLPSPVHMTSCYHPLQILPPSVVLR